MNIQGNMNNKINEDLKRFNALLGYDPQKGNQISEAKMRRPAPGYLNEEEPEEGEEEETEGGEFDFGDEEGGEEETTDFDFGDEGNPEDEEEVDEFGTADEFSAADEIETTEEDVEEIDVTSLVKGSDEAKEMARQAAEIGNQNMTYLKSLTDKLSNLESQLSKMDTIASKLGKLEQDIKTPEERLELRSLDSYPFNTKLSDYWEEKASKDDRYRISTGKEMEDGQEREYVLNSKNVDEDYSEESIKKSFNPTQKS
jgi:hypothetical protein